jgi:phosphoglycolate phosphatase
MFRAAVDRFGILPLPGLNEALAKLSAAGIKICLMSSLSRPAMSLIVERLDWGQRADLMLCADDVPRGFPWPDLILSAVLRLGVGVLSDVDDASRLRRAGATHLLTDAGELPDLVAAPAGITTSD